jgi:hypothetical protein
MLMNWHPLPGGIFRLLLGIEVVEVTKEIRRSHAVLAVLVTVAGWSLPNDRLHIRVAWVPHAAHALPMSQALCRLPDGSRICPAGADQLRNPRKAYLFDRPAALLPGGSLRQDPRTREANADTCWHLL